MTDFRRHVSKHGLDVVMSSLLTAVAFGSVAQFPVVLLALKLNVFVVPVALTTDVFAFPPWVWYVLALTWARQAAMLFGVEFADVPRRVGRLRDRATSSNTIRAEVPADD